MWGCFDNCVVVLVICVLVFTVFCTVCTVFCIVSFMYIYSYLLCLYWCSSSSSSNSSSSSSSTSSNNNNIKMISFRCLGAKTYRQKLNQIRHSFKLILEMA